MTSKPTISGFTFINHAIELDYPVVECIKSMLPICDEFIVNIGTPDDGTVELIRCIDDKIKIIETPWYPKRVKKGGWRYDQFADIALFSCGGDWIFFLQGDEVVHEKDLPKIEEAVAKYNGDLEVEGLALTYYHFYGGYDYYRIDRRWPPGGVRVVRNGINVYAAGDAQTFYIGEKKKMRYLNVAEIDAGIYHYGWARNPEAMKKKSNSVDEYWSDEKRIAVRKRSDGKAVDFYNLSPNYLAKFGGTHPEVMRDRIAKHDWTFDISKCHQKKSFKILRYELEWGIEKALKKRVFGPHYYKTIKKFNLY